MSSGDEWEVVDIVRTSTDKIPHPAITGSIALKEPAANKKDVERLATDIKQQLNLKNAEQTQNLLLLSAKMQHQQKLSEQQLNELHQQLSTITHLQNEERRKVAESVKNSNYKQYNQQKQIEEQALKLSKLQNLLKTQNNILKTTQKQQIKQEMINVQQAVQFAHQQRHQQMPPVLQPLHSLPMQPLNMLPPMQPLPILQQPQQSSVPIMHNNNNNNNSWFPSFLSFDNNSNSNALQNQTLPPQPTVSFDFNSNSNSNQGMEDCPWPLPSQSSHQVINHHFLEEKSNRIMDDDDAVLSWTNDYGSNNPLISDPGLLKTKQVIGGGIYEPGEERQCGWLLENTSNIKLQLSCTLNEKMNENERNACLACVKCCPEKLYEFILSPKEEIFILLEVVAPACVGKYCKFFQLCMVNGGYEIGEILEIVCEVKGVFGKEREKKIEQIVKMGFGERKVIVKTLKMCKWNVGKAVDKLVVIGSD